MRPIYLLLGFLFLVLAGIGVVVPGMPVTIFCILALWAFKKSSPKMEAWLLNHPVVGPTLRDWDENKSIAPRTKAIAVCTLWAMLLISMFFVSQKGVVLLAIVGIAVSAYILTRKTKVNASSGNEKITSDKSAVTAPITTILP